MAKRGRPPGRRRDTVSVSMRMDPDLHQDTRQLALNQKTSMNRLLEKALERLVQEAREQGQLGQSGPTQR